MRVTARVRDVLAAVFAAYPASLAAEWDTGIGLTCGDPDDPVSSVLLAVDADAATVTEAIELGAQVLLTHHPLLFHPVQSVALDPAGTGKGALVHRLVRAGIAHIAAHTNADSAAGGVNDALADRLGLADLRPLDAVSGIGRVGLLEGPMSLQAFVARVAARLPATAAGVRAAGDPGRTIRRVAVCGGAGDGELDAATASGADAYLTSDLRHHVAADHLADPARPALVEVAHWAGEWPWLARAAETIDRALAGTVRCTVSRVRTDPWTIHVSSGVADAVPGSSAGAREPKGT